MGCSNNHNTDPLIKINSDDIVLKELVKLHNDCNEISLFIKNFDKLISNINGKDKIEALIEDISIKIKNSNLNKLVYTDIKRIVYYKLSINDLKSTNICNAKHKLININNDNIRDLIYNALSNLDYKLRNTLIDNLKIHLNLPFKYVYVISNYLDNLDLDSINVEDRNNYNTIFSGNINTSLNYQKYLINNIIDYKLLYLYKKILDKVILSIDLLVIELDTLLLANRNTLKIIKLFLLKHINNVRFISIILYVNELKQESILNITDIINNVYYILSGLYNGITSNATNKYIENFMFKVNNSLCYNIEFSNKNISMLANIIQSLKKLSILVLIDLPIHTENILKIYSGINKNNTLKILIIKYTKLSFDISDEFILSNNIKNEIFKLTQCIANSKSIEIAVYGINYPFEIEYLYNAEKVIKAGNIKFKNLYFQNLNLIDI